MKSVSNKLQVIFSKASELKISLFTERNSGGNLGQTGHLNPPKNIEWIQNICKENKVPYQVLQTVFVPVVEQESHTVKRLTFDDK